MKACPSKLRPECPPIPANRNTMGPTYTVLKPQALNLPEDWGWQATLGGLGSFWRKTQMASNEGPGTGHLRQVPEKVDV